MNLEFYNTPQPDKLDAERLPQDPDFLHYRPDFELIKKYADELGQYENIIIIANGGSITTFNGYYFALRYQTEKRVYFLSTVDPDYIYELKNKLKPENTL